MGIHKMSDSILVNRQCVAYVEMGRERELAILFSIMGITNEGVAITDEDIREHAEAVCEEWGVKNESKATCHVCSALQPKNRLCACYFNTLITTLNLSELFLKLPNEAIAFSYICTEASCKKISTVPVRVVRQQYVRHGKYAMPTRCFGCHNKGAKPSRGSQKPAYTPPTLGDTSKKLVELQREVADSSAIAPEG